MHVHVLLLASTLLYKFLLATSIPSVNDENNNVEFNFDRIFFDNFGGEDFKSGPDNNLKYSKDVESESNSSTISSQDHDSSSDYCPRSRSKKRKRTKPQSTKKAKSDNENENDQSGLTRKISSTPTAKPKKRDTNRSRFLYRTKCTCDKNKFTYVSSALNHMAFFHADLTDKGYSDVIELVGDAKLIENCPYTCQMCPFRTENPYNLTKHNLRVHNRRL
mgnify:CR=1 FL=1